MGFGEAVPRFYVGGVEINSLYRTMMSNSHFIHEQAMHIDDYSNSENNGKCSDIILTTSPFWLHHGQIPNS